jgi:hypothetical protein
MLGECSARRSSRRAATSGRSRAKTRSSRRSDSSTGSASQRRSAGSAVASVTGVGGGQPLFFLASTAAIHSGA